MSINFKRAAGVVLVLLGSLMIVSMAEAMDFKMKLSGWNDGPRSVDINNDGSPAVSVTAGGKGTFGKSTSNFLAEIGMPDAVWFGDSCPTGAFIEYVTFTMITRYENGDLIFFALDDPGENSSSMCFSVAPEDFYYGYSTVNLLITGGTGRFEGATGWAIMTGVLYPALQWTMDGSAAHSAHSGSLKGEIFLSEDD